MAKYVMARPPVSMAEAQLVRQLALSLNNEAQIILLSWQGKHATAIAHALYCPVPVVRERLHMFNAHGLSGLQSAGKDAQAAHIPQEDRSSLMDSGEMRSRDAKFERALQAARAHGVPNQLLHTYLQMNGEFPMAPAATDPAVGYEVVAAIARHGTPDPAEIEPAWKSAGLEWISYYYSGFSPLQIAAIGHTVTQIHLDAGIPIVTAEQLSAVAEMHPANREKIAQLPAILARDFLQADHPFIPPNCTIQPTEYGTLAVVAPEVFQDGWNDIKERVFLAVLNFLDAIPGVSSRLTRIRLDAKDGSPLTAENALRLAQFSAHTALRPYQDSLLTCYKTAYATIIASEDLAKEQHTEYQLTSGGKPEFRVTRALAALIQRIADAVQKAAGAFPAQRNGAPLISPAAITGFVNDITRRVSEPTN